MEHNPLESVNQASQTTSSEKETLQQELQDTQKRREEMLARAGEFYDIELYDLFVKAADLGKQNLVELYIESTGNDYGAVKANYKKYEQFKDEQLRPIDAQIHAIERKIGHLHQAERDAQAQLKQQEATEKYTAEKDQLETALFNALEEIHGRLPKEYVQLGMTTEAAMKTYLPSMMYRASQLEQYLAELDAVQDERELKRLKERIERDRISI